MPTSYVDFGFLLEPKEYHQSTYIIETNKLGVRSLLYAWAKDAHVPVVVERMPNHEGRRICLQVFDYSHLFKVNTRIADGWMRRLARESSSFRYESHSSVELDVDGDSIPEPPTTVPNPWDIRKESEIGRAHRYLRMMEWLKVFAEEAREREREENEERMRRQRERRPLSTVERLKRQCNERFTRFQAKLDQCGRVMMRRVRGH